MRLSILLAFVIFLYSCKQPNSDKASESKPVQTERAFPKYSLEDFDLKYFTKYPALERFVLLFDSIVPSDYFAYWECIYKDDSSNDYQSLYVNRGRRLIYNGDSLSFDRYSTSVNSDRGFFYDCAPLYTCFYYIVAVKPSRETLLINSEAMLKSFIGKIDNDEEAGLIARMNGYFIDNESMVCGSYRKRQNDFLLHLLEIEEDSLHIERSVRAILTNDGRFKVVDKKVVKTEESYGID